MRFYYNAKRREEWWHGHVSMLLSIRPLTVTKKCQRKVVKYNYSHPSITENMVVEWGWTKGPCGRAKSAPKQPIGRAVRWIKATEKRPSNIIIVILAPFNRNRFLHSFGMYLFSNCPIVQTIQPYTPHCELIVKHCTINGSFLTKVPSRDHLM